MKVTGFVCCIFKSVYDPHVGTLFIFHTCPNEVSIPFAEFSFYFCNVNSLFVVTTVVTHVQKIMIGRFGLRTARLTAERLSD